MSTYLPDPAVENRTLTKVTWRLIPFLVLLYIVNYLDRVNIAFAGPNGMNDELGMSAKMFGFASGIFFLGYLLLEVPSNTALHKFGGRRWLARIMVSWGIISAAIAFVPNAETLIVLRFLLGVAEAGFFPGIILYLTFWFPEKQRSRAVSLFMVAVPVSTAVGSTISSLIIDWGHGMFGLAGWRFMFLVEGLPAVILGVICWFYLTDRPGAAEWLRTDEKRWLEGTLDDERAIAESAGHWPLKKALTHPRILALAFIYFGITYGLYAVGFFLPTIVAGFQEEYGVHLDVIQRGLVTSIPYVVAAIVMVPWAWHSDRTGERVWHVAIPAIVGGIAIPGGPVHDRRLPGDAGCHAVHLRGHVRAARVLVSAIGLPDRGRGRRWYRADQLARQSERVRRSVHHRPANRPDGQQQGGVVGGGHAVVGGRRPGRRAGQRARGPGVAPLQQSPLAGKPASTPSMISAAVRAARSPSPAAICSSSTP